jgi:glycosyltransferase involved in cell wall biosynthesis
VFRHLARRDDLDFQVLFAMLPNASAQGSGFGVDFEWDLPLLEGYEYSVLANTAKHPSVTQFAGCDTPCIIEELKRKQIDVVVVNGWVVKTCLQTLRACKKLGIPCIVRGEANNLRPRPWWKRVLQRQLVRRYDAYLPIGTASREFYRGHGISDDLMFDARYCIENDRFQKAAEAAAGRETTIRVRWRVPEDSLCLLYCGKFELKKHPLELLQSIAHAVQQGARLHLLMVGDGELRAASEAFVQEQRLPVSFTGFLNQSEIVDAYIASDILVLPSDHGETWGLVVNEAMACGRPAIVSDQVGCAADLIVEGETGWTFPFGDWQTFTELLVQIAEVPEQVHGMSEVCVELVQSFSPLAAANGIAQAVQFVASQPQQKERFRRKDGERGV